MPQHQDPPPPKSSTVEQRPCSTCTTPMRLSEIEPEKTGNDRRVMDIDRFVRRTNVARYRRLLDAAPEAIERQRLGRLLAEEQQKQKKAEDPEFRY